MLECADERGDRKDVKVRPTPRVANGLKIDLQYHPIKLESAIRYLNVGYDVEKFEELREKRRMEESKRVRPFVKESDGYKKRRVLYHRMTFTNFRWFSFELLLLS